MRKLAFFFCLFIFSLNLFSQEEKQTLVQFSGIVVVDGDDTPIPYTTIVIKNTYRGTIANMHGFFSIAMKPNDTIIFSAIGFKKKKINLPSTFTGESFTTLIQLEKDTLTYDETVIYPWPSPDEFKTAFLALEVDKDYYDIARENLDPTKMMILNINMGMDGSENQKYYMNQMAVKAGYYGGQTEYAIFPGANTPIPLSLLNPLAWAEFIKTLKSGGFKDKYKDYR